MNSTSVDCDLPGWFGPDSVYNKLVAEREQLNMLKQRKIFMKERVSRYGNLRVSGGAATRYDSNCHLGPWNNPNYSINVISLPVPAI